MGLSVDLELACDNIEMNSKHNVFLTPIDRIEIDDKKMSEAAVAVVDSVASRPIAAKVKLNESSKSPVQNDGVKIDADDAEPEEGEILNSEEETNDFEYEAISSDEEYTLRQKIEALEARNSELEKIHSISARSQDAYDIGSGATSTIYGSYKHNAPQFVDEKCFKTSTKHRKFKQFLMTHTNPHKVSVRTPSDKRSMDVISSDDECIGLSDIGNGALYRENAKFYDRAHHHHSSSSSRRRKHYRDHHDRRYSDDERETACRSHAKRRGYDIVKAKRRRLKPVLTSSDDDCFEVTSREELKVALNIGDGLSADSAINRSTLLHKLRAIQNKSTNDSDQEDTAKKKSTATKKRCRHKTKSHSEAVQIPIGDDVDSDEQAINEAIIDAIFVDATNHDIHGPTEDDDGVDEAVLLEEQELRLIALKSAVMKKHEARKKRQLVLSIRAYSPTDSLLTPLDEDGTCAGGDHGDDGDVDDDAETVNQLEVNDDTEDNNNMDISPASSPESNQACQSMDMDLVSSNDDDSQSPVVFSSLPKDVSLAQPNNDHYVNWVYGIPLVRNQNFNHFLITGGETAYSNENLAPIAHPMDQIQLPFDSNANGSMANQIVSMTSEEENSLRARLIADLNCSENKKKTVDVIPPSITTTDVRVNAVADDTNQDESLEADCLRSLLLSSIKHKKSRSTDIEQNNRNKNVNQSDDDHSIIGLPELTEITSNLKEAVKRFQNKNKPKEHTEPTTVPEPAVIEVIENLKLDNVPVESNSNALAPVATPSQSEMTPKNDQKALKSTMTVQPSAGKVATVKMQQTDIATAAQTSPKLITTKEIGPLPAKSVTSVAKVIKIATGNVDSATVMTDTNKARSSPIFSTKEKYSPASSSSSTTKIESAKKSATVNILPWKPVQKLIISLKADDSSTSDFEDDADTSSEMDQNNESNALTSSGMSTDALRAFDNASPASIAMDSPSMAPCSPIDGENSLTASTDANEDSPLAVDSEKNSDAFQMKLDEYLKQVRAKTDATPDELPLNDCVAPEKPKLIATKPTEKKTIITLKQKTPVAVCHLPISAQLEYRRLINRMKILEKQKEQKSTQFKQQKMQQNLPTVTTSDTPFANIRVTLKNENRFIQTNECKVDHQEEQKSVSSSLPPPSPSNVAKLKDSLKKKVLLKNTLNAAAAASNAANESNTQNSTKKSFESQMPSKNEMALNGMQVDRRVNEEKVAILRKTEAKVNVYSKNLLTELDAMLQLVCQTHVETTKQIELEKRLHQLRLQCKAVEDELKHQKKRTSSMLPEIVAKQKAVETRKTVSRKMSLYCDRMGRKFFGDDYKYHCDMEDQIKDKIKSIQCKTKSLRTMAVSLPELPWLSSVDKAKAQLNTSGASIGIENPSIATSSIISTPSKSSAVTVAALAEDNLLICVKNSSLIEDDSIPDRVVQQLQGAVIVTEDKPSSALTINDNIAMLNKEDDASGGKKYRSPLDHMQNNIGSSAGQSLTDRNAIVCPFDLMGTCDDEKCLYRHLSS